jgi:hypothetical protein
LRGPATVFECLVGEGAYFARVVSVKTKTKVMLVRARKEMVEW